MEDFTGNTSKLGDWLIYQGRKKFVEVFRGMLSGFYACRSLHRLSRQSPDRTDTEKSGAIDMRESSLFIESNFFCSRS